MRGPSPPRQSTTNSYTWTPSVGSPSFEPSHFTPPVPKGIRSGMSVQDLKMLTAIREQGLHQQQHYHHHHSFHMHALATMTSNSSYHSYHSGHNNSDNMSMRLSGGSESDFYSTCSGSSYTRSMSQSSYETDEEILSDDNSSTSSLSSRPSSPCRFVVTAGGQRVQLVKGVVNIPRDLVLARSC